MSPKKNPNLQDIRRRAERLVKTRQDMPTADNVEDYKKLVEELHIHRIELELQNEELRSVQLTLAAARNAYADLFNNAPIGYLILDKRGMVVESNRTFAEMIGLDVADVIRRPFQSFLASGAGKVFLGTYKAFYNNPNGKQMDLELDCHDGENRFIRLYGSRVISPDGSNRNEKLRAAVIDVTRQKVAEVERWRSHEALEEREERLRFLFSHVGDGVYVHDADGKLIQVNSQACRLTGYNEPEILRLNMLDIDGSYSTFEEYRRTILPDGMASPKTVQTVHRRKDGSTFPVEMAVAAIHAGDDTMFIATARDITERQRRESDLRQAEKAESLARMAGSVAHHFNNKLMVTIGNLQMARVNLPQDSGIEGYLGDAELSARKASEMSSMMLTYLGQEQRRTRPVDLARLCRGCLEEQGTGLINGVKLHGDLAETGPFVMADRGQIEQVIRALVKNGLEALEEESAGSVTLSTECVTDVDVKNEYIFPRGWQPAAREYVRLVVSDTGRGMPEQTLERIFDPFFTEKYLGRGIGLAVVSGIVKSHGGCIAVESRPGEGSVFTVYLPLPSTAQVETSFSEVGRAHTVSGDGAILLVDDDRMVRRLVEAMLKANGFEVINAEDGVEAIDLFRKNRSRIGLVITDLSMPRMNGWETLEAIRETGSDVPVIMASGYNEAHAMAGKHQHEPDAFFQKPFEMEALQEVFQQLSGK